MHIPGVHTLETTRMWLHSLTPEVYQALMEGHGDAAIREYLGLADAAALEREKSQYRQGLATWNRSFVYFRMLLKENGRMIGKCGFHTWYLPHARAELGYALDAETDKGKGLMKEALPAVLQYGFEVMGLHRVEAFIGPANVASLKLVHGLGFTEEGRLREHYYKNGRAEDSVVFSLLNREFGERTEP